MAMRTPVVESPVKAPEVEPTIAPEVRFDAKIPSREGEVNQLEKGTQAITSGLEEMNKSFEKQAEFAVQNQYEAKLISAKNQIAGDAKVYHGTDVMAAVGPATEKFQKTTDDIAKGITDPRQKDVFTALTKQYSKSLDDEVAQHVAENIPRVYQEHLDANLNGQLASASANYNNPASLEETKKNLDKLVDNHAEATSLNAQQKEDFKQGVYRKYYESIIQSYLANGDAKSAKEAFKKYEDNGGGGGKADRINKSIDMVANKQDAMEKFTKGIRYDAAGYPDPSKIVGEINNDPSLSKIQKDAQVKIVNAEAGRVRSALDKQKGDRWKSFQDDVAKAREGGMSLDKQLDMVPKSGATGREAERMMDYINAPFIKKSGLNITIGGGKTPMQLQAHQNLFEAIDEGRLTNSEDIGKLYDQGVLTPKEYAQALRKFDTVSKGGVNREMNVTRNQIRRQAMDVLPDQESVNKFMIDMASATENTKDPQALQDYAKKKLDPVLKNPAAFYDRITGQKNGGQNVSDEEMTKALNFEVGKEPTSAILSSLATPDNPKPKLEDIDGFLHALGDVPLEALGRGKPLNNTMNSILNWNRMNPTKKIPFSPEAIKVLSEKHPDGYF